MLSLEHLSNVSGISVDAGTCVMTTTTTTSIPRPTVRCLPSVVIGNNNIINNNNNNNNNNISGIHEVWDRGTHETHELAVVVVVGAWREEEQGRWDKKN